MAGAGAEGETSAGTGVSRTSAEGAAPMVSVVIVNWNTRDLLEQTLRTLYEQTTVPFEAIVVDNGSVDGSAELVRTAFPQALLVPLPENRGFAAANNIGFSHAVGRYILLLNSDTIVLPSTVAGLAALLDEHAVAGCAGARHLNADLSLQRSVDNAPSLLNDLLSYTELQRLAVFGGLLRRRFAWWADHDAVRTVGWVNGSCMMVRREVLDAVGGLDEGFFIYAEELDWCYRMWGAGFSVYFTPDAEVIHLGGQAMNSAVSRRLVLKYTGQLRFYLKNYSYGRYLALRAIVAGVALVRLTMLLGLAAVAPLGLRPSERVWEVLTQENVMTNPRTMLRVWWKILCLPRPSVSHDSAWRQISRA